MRRDPDRIAASSRSAMAKGSSSFSVAANFFDGELRQDVWQLYAWCRYCDDQIDGQTLGHEAQPLAPGEKRARLERLRCLTRAALAGEPVTEHSFVALQRVCSRHAIAERWPLELLDGFAMDVEDTRYLTCDDTLRYCWGVAGSVGVMMAQIMGARQLAVLRRAQDLGIAFQLTNICRDVVEDGRNHRLYLPAEWLESAGVPATPAAMLNAAQHPAVFTVVSRLTALAECYYDSARVGFRDLPFRGTLAVASASGIYREIGRRIGRRGPLALQSRMSVPRVVKLRFLFRGVALALTSRFESRRVPERPPLWSHI